MVSVMEDVAEMTYTYGLSTFVSVCCRLAVTPQAEINLRSLMATRRACPPTHSRAFRQPPSNPH